MPRRIKRTITSIPSVPSNVPGPPPNRPDLINPRKIITQSVSIQLLLEQLEDVAATDSTVLLLGETGVGKSLFAERIHLSSRRREEPFFAMNCSAIPQELIESELFGHEKGSFTGANKERRGKFLSAHGGTLFLDEIGDLAPLAQVKLLRILDDGWFYPVGSDVERRVDVRLITATNKNLKKMVLSGEFRKDLFYRINVMPLHIPPLCERLDDIPLLMDYYFFQKKRSHLNSDEDLFIHPEAIAKLKEYKWPGNVRELENILERSLILRLKNSEINVIMPENIQFDPLEPDPATSSFAGNVNVTSSTLKEVEDRAAYEAICKALKQHLGNRTVVAKELNTSLRRIRELLEKFESTKP